MKVIADQKDFWRPDFRLDVFVCLFFLLAERLLINGCLLGRHFTIFMRGRRKKVFVV